MKRFTLTFRVPRNILVICIYVQNAEKIMQTQKMHRELKSEKCIICNQFYSVTFLRYTISFSKQN